MTDRAAGPAGPVDTPRAERAARADAMERAVTARHLRSVWGLPGSTLGVVSWPPTTMHRLSFPWHYWWQAHLIDCAIDAHLRHPTARRHQRIRRLTASHRLRNLTGWTNSYFDDMAWLALALERAGRLAQAPRPAGLAALVGQLTTHWTERALDDEGVVTRIGGLPWRRRDDFFNTPANGPAAIVLARVGRIGRARQMADWLDAVLRDPATGLMWDGVRPSGLATEIYSYCQGVAIGAEVELALRVDADRHVPRVTALVRAVADHLVDDRGVLVGGGGGDGGLFNGILARYLALTAMALPGEHPQAAATRAVARAIVLDSAEAAWQHRAEVDEMPLLGHDWTRPAVVPHRGSGLGRSTDGATSASATPERDLSVQLGGWTLLEAAAALPQP